MQATPLLRLVAHRPYAETLESSVRKHVDWNVLATEASTSNREICIVYFTALQIFPVASITMQRTPRTLFAYASRRGWCVSLEHFLYTCESVIHQERAFE